MEFIAPEFTINNHDYECHQSDSQYKKCFSNQYEYKGEDNPEIFPTGSELTEIRKLGYQQIIQAEKRQALQGIAQKLIILLIDFFVFFAHWVLARRARETS